MKSLAERHEARAQRIVSNGTELDATTSGSLGTVIAAYGDFATAYATLTDEEKDQVKETFKDIDGSFGSSDSLSEAPDGSRRTMAGIGVVNTQVVPAGVDLPKAGNGGGTKVDSVDGWGANASPAAFTETREGDNLGGAALQDQGAGSDLKASAKQAEADIKEGSVPGATSTEKPKSK